MRQGETDQAYPACHQSLRRSHRANSDIAHCGRTVDLLQPPETTFATRTVASPITISIAQNIFAVCAGGADGGDPAGAAFSFFSKLMDCKPREKRTGP